MDKNIKRLVASINKTNRLRVWSVIITFFGDAIVPRGGSVSARTVQEVMARLGIEDGAVRTAFSRLTQDGWAAREKVGRASYYSLSESGLELSKNASREIYAPLQAQSPDNEAWLIAVSQQSSTPPVLLASPSEQDIKKYTDNNCLILSGKLHNVPDWMKAQLAPPEAAIGYNQLLKNLFACAEWSLTDIDSLALRCILIHEWRRLLLRYHHAPPPLRPTNWPEDECQSLVMNLYQQLLPTSEDWLDQSATGPAGNLPTAEDEVNPASNNTLQNCLIYKIL